MKRKTLRTLLLLVAAAVGWTGTALDVTPEEMQAIKEVREKKAINPRAARQRIEQALSLQRTSPLLFEAAILHAETGDNQQALKYLNEVIELDEQFPGAYANRGQILAALGRVKPAIQDLLKGMKQSGPDEQTMKLLSQFYTELGQPAAAEIGLRWSLLYDPENVQLYQLLAANMLEQQRYPEAEKLGYSAVQMETNDPVNWRLYINALLAQEHFNEAIDALEMARRLVDNIPADLLRLLGNLYLQKGMNIQVGELYQSVDALTSMTDDQLKTLVNAFIAYDDAENAAKITKILAERAPDDAETLYYCACTERLVGNSESATRLADRAVANDSGYGKGYILLAELNLEREDYAKALDAVRTARSFTSLEQEALTIELEIWMKQENWREALDVLELLIDASTDPSWIRLRDSIVELIAESE